MIHHSLKFIVLTILFLSLLTCKNPGKQKNTEVQNEVPAFVVPDGGVSLFDGKTLGNWEVTRFGTEGPVRVADGKLVINMGDGASGVTWTKDFPKVNYEVHLEAQKTVGNDFFCGITFPVNDSFCSLIVGGWGGPVVGLSCIDGVDASENETYVLKRLDRDIWYPIKLRVTDTKIEAWVENEKLVDFSYAGRELSIRPEVNLSRPFGICTWLTTGELRNIWMKEIQVE